MNEKSPLSRHFYICSGSEGVVSGVNVSTFFLNTGHKFGGGVEAGALKVMLTVGLESSCFSASLDVFAFHQRRKDDADEELLHRAEAGGLFRHTLTPGGSVLSTTHQPSTAKMTCGVKDKPPRQAKLSAGNCSTSVPQALWNK